MSTTSDEKMLRQVVDEQRRYAARELEQIINRVRFQTTIEFRRRITFNSYGVVTLGEWGGYLIQIMPMAFNHRLVMTPQAVPMVYDYGWCYPKGAAPLLAALVWNPQAEAEPQGFIKRIGVIARVAGQRSPYAPLPD